jgi:hypothetical protein
MSDANKRILAEFDFVDLIGDAISDSLDMDWTVSIGARAVMADLGEELIALMDAARRDERAALEAEVGRLREDLDVIHRAASHCQGKFGGRMSEVDRIFQEITRVSSMHKTRAALKTKDTDR